jgi:BMFP domain-containing protein YqiC
MVARDEFEAVKAIAIAAREESQALRARIEALEAGAGAAKPSTRARRTPGGGGDRTAGDGGAGS